MNLTATIAGFNFEHIMLNAAGVMCQTAEELDSVLASAHTGAVVTKVSCTTDASVLGTLSSRGGEASYQYCNKQP